jgi:hypothetical protein
VSLYPSRIGYKMILGIDEAGLMLKPAPGAVIVENSVESLHHQYLMWTSRT